MNTETIIIGTADAIEAEYGYASVNDTTYTVLILYNGEFAQLDGYDDLARAKAEYLWGEQHDANLARSFMII